MALFRVQNGGGPYIHFDSEDAPSRCGVWDPVNARFQTCFLPIISIIPAAIAICILLGLLLKLLPRGLLTIKWLSNIIQEPEEEKDDLHPTGKRYTSRLTISLFVASTVGLILQILTIFYPALRMDMMIFLTIAWAVAFLLVAIFRPYTVPKTLLVLYISIFVSQTIILLDGVSRLGRDNIPSTLAPLAAIGTIAIILNMPLRNPSLPTKEISPAFGPSTSELRSPEDNLTLWQYMTVSWMAPLITLGNTRQLNDDDVWDLGYEFKHKLLSDKFRELKGTVLSRLFQANGLDLVIISLLATFELVADYSAPIFLQKILQSMEDPYAPKRATFTYALLSFVIRLISAQASVFTLWYGRRCYERSRGEMITMLYEKTLSRKVVSISSKARTEENAEQATNGHGKKEEQPQWRKVLGYVLYPIKTCCSRSKKSKDKKDLASMGKILNLMRNDAYEVAQRFWEFDKLITQPIGLVFSVVLVWRLIGWPCLLGVLTVFFAQIANAFIARVLLKNEAERRKATDVKLNKISQLVESIRHLRWYGWQDVWLTRIMEARQHELALRVVTSIWRLMINFTNIFASGMFPVVAFYAYTSLARLPLRVDIAFPALQLFTMLERTLKDLPNLITVLLNARVAAQRLEAFMKEPDKAEADDSGLISTKVETKNASFAWPGAEEPVLHDITVSFPPGMTVICGEVGSGKTALLQALLGEADLTAGEYHRTNEMVGYCGQTPWLQSMSIRENILFSAPYEETRYQQVIEACALIPDMANFKNGDLSLIGENGIGLSGGQKARVALARAVYARANILFLDDPLSALDHQTADFIVRRCFKGPLLEGRTTILVTHRTELCLPLAEQVIEVKNGRAQVLDPKSVAPDTLQRTKSNESTEEHEKEDQEKEAAIPDKFMEDEHRAEGGVMLSVYWEYIKAGKLKWWVVLVISIALYRLIDIGETWFLKQWGEAYGQVQLLDWNPFRHLPSPEENVKPWLLGFFILAVAQSAAFLISQSFMLVIVYQAGKNLFARVMTRVTHATFRFYDTTPVGRLMNRLTSDINTIDGNISMMFQMAAMLSIIWISSIVVIASVTPLFLIFAIVLSISFIVIFSYFLPTSQSLRRLEMVSLSPLISNFGALGDGLTTIRAFCAQYRFQERVIAVTDNFQKMDHFYWSLQAWLMYRFDFLTASSTFLMTTLALFTNVSPGLTAFVLAAASRFVNSTHALCRVYGQLQMDFVSVERVVELLHLEEEPPGSVPPPAYWPKLGGDIIFEDVTIQYAPHLDPALLNVSLTIKGGSATALIGRTGSGKSTLALSLLATTPPSTGKILIDGIDIAKVDKQALRKRVTFLAQEPVLFPGTMRANLDPLDEYSDDECSSVLSKIASRHAWTLDMHIDTGGKNLSQGQRQLVGLARALLRRSPIVIMDEATASIDMETALRIQEILREEMRESTVITIAHRVEAVKGADYCVVLAKGRVSEVGEPGKMVGRMGGEELA